MAEAEVYFKPALDGHPPGHICFTPTSLFANAELGPYDYMRAELSIVSPRHFRPLIEPFESSSPALASPSVSVSGEQLGRLLWNGASEYEAV